MTLVKKFFPLIISLITFIVYLTTLAPTVIQIDTGELAAVQSLLGIAHPTGYPLFTLSGYLFSLIPLSMSKIAQLNLLAAIWCSISIGIFAYTSEYVLDNIVRVRKGFEGSYRYPKKAKQKKKSAEIPAAPDPGIPEGKKYTASAAGAFILAFSTTYWFQSTSVEVYSLHLLLINLIILFLIKSYVNRETGTGVKRYWYIFAAVLALGFSNHMTTLLILPGTAFLYFSSYGFNKKSLKRLGLMILLFLILLVLLYSYLPIRASQNPLLNWGNPIDMERILRHISGKQYQTWIFSSTESAKKQLTYFVNNLPSEFSISLLISAVGIFASFRYFKKLAWFFVITFLSTVLYSINYDINDIDAYFLLAFISLGFFAVFGSLKLLTFLKTGKFSYSIPAFLITAFIIVQVFIIYPRTDQSSTYTFEDYTKALINSTEQNAIIFSYQWDFFISSSYYFSLVEGFRTDVAVIDKELLRRSWYYHQLDTMHPGLLDGLKPEINQFLEALKPFERSENYNANLLENLFRRIMTGIPETNDDRPYYVGPELYDIDIQKGEFILPQGYNLVPDLFLFRLVKGNGYTAAPDPDYTIRFPERSNRYTEYIADFCARMLVRRALYEMQFDKPERAKKYIQKLKKDFPSFPVPEGLAAVLAPGNN